MRTRASNHVAQMARLRRALEAVALLAARVDAEQMEPARAIRIAGEVVSRELQRLPS